MSNPLLALLNKAGSQLSPSASAKATEHAPSPSPSPLPPSPPSAPSSLASPSSPATAVKNGPRSPTDLSSLLSPGLASPPTSFAPHASLLSLLSTATPPAAPARGAESSSVSADATSATAGPSNAPSTGSRSRRALGSRVTEDPLPSSPSSDIAKARLLGLLTGPATSFELVQEERKTTPAPQAAAEQSHSPEPQQTRPPVPSSQTSYAHAAAQPSKFDFQSSFDQFLPGEVKPTQPAKTLDTGLVRRPAEPQLKEEDGVSSTKSASASSVAPQSIPGPPPFQKISLKKDVRASSDRIELKPAEEFLASKYVAALHREHSFAEESTSGLSNTQQSPMTTTIDLDLVAPQPAGVNSLHPAKLEISQIALVDSSFEHHASDIYAEGIKESQLLSQLHTSKITNLGEDVVAYAMNKGRIRLLHLRTGERAMLQVPHKRTILTIRAFAASDESDWRVLAVFDGSEDGKAEGTFVWKVTLDGSFQSEALATISSQLSNYRLLACQQGSKYSYDAHLCALIDAQPGGSVKAAMAHLFSDLGQLSQSTQAQASVSHEHQVVAAAIASQRSAYAAIEVGSEVQVVVRSSAAGGLARVNLPPLGDIDEPLPPVSFIAPVHPQESAKEEGRTAILVGFARNTIIGLFDVQNGWRYIWRFQNMPGDHFNLAHFNEEASTLFLANSARSSIFTLQLLVSSGGPKHQWSLHSPQRLIEYALPEPCTSFSITRKQSNDAVDGFKIFAVHPGGVHSFEIPLPSPVSDPDDDQPSTARALADDSKQYEDAKVEQTADVPHEVTGRDTAEGGEVKSVAEQPVAADDATHDQARSSLERGEATMQFSELPTADMLPSSHQSQTTAPVSSATAAQPGSISMAEQGRTHSRRGTRGGSKTKKAVANEDGTHSRTASSTTNADTVTNGASTHAKADLKSRSANDAEPKEVGFDDAALQKHLQSMETRLTDKLGKMISSSAKTTHASPAVELPPSSLSTIAGEVAKILSAEINAAIVPQVLASLRSVTQTEMRGGFSEAVQQHLPAELSRLIDRPDVHTNITRAVSAGVVPVAQRTAVEVVTQVLAPHFEQTMLGVAQRVEAVIGSGLTDVRKSIVAEQGTALKATEKSIAEMSSALTLMSKQVTDLSTQNEALSKTLEELKRSGIHREVPPAPSSAANLARQISPGHPQSPWVPIEPFQSPFAQPSSFGPGGPPYPSHPPIGGPPNAYAPWPPGPTSYQAARGPQNDTYHNNVYRGTPAPQRPIGGEEVVEDALLSALSSSNPETAILPVLQRLKVQHGRAEAALLQRDAVSGVEKLTVSQPVLLALLNALSNIAKAAATYNTASGSGPEVFVPWAEACAMRLDVADDSIKAAYSRVQERIRRGFEEGWAEHHVKVDSMWWSRGRLDAYLLRFLPVA
ncbi:hypothetical protein BCV69DRAFT_314966 [Microstroma glucosiphilum]|uniref:Uncharacterized protein n=1 Tax=Pseudomicrostroma glucosiphilum TaxID=1684307 RepID=A0A316TYJ9_9BASI|nr:hypothetical protein BCV69DRAFT_314966 [Pseudomicrostroma glucosiphilum]PWN18130.1 hypothetical protein BCV69DRAFT_314966 [Pseudomicrostroma glucosiphilum]